MGKLIPYSTPRENVSARALPSAGSVWMCLICWRCRWIRTAEFLQEDAAAATRTQPEGLQAAFTSTFPVSHNGFARSRITSYIAGRAGLRREGMPAAGPDLRVAAARCRCSSDDLR